MCVALVLPAFFSLWMPMGTDSTERPVFAVLGYRVIPGRFRPHRGQEASEPNSGQHGELQEAAFAG